MDLIITNFNNCGASGRNGPNWFDVECILSRTNLEGNVSISTQGSLGMDCSKYWHLYDRGNWCKRRNIERNSKIPGRGAMIRADFNLVAGQVLVKSRWTN